MDTGLVALLAVTAVALSVPLWAVWFRAWVRRRRADDPSFIPPVGLGVWDEIYRPATYAATQQRRVEERRTDATGEREP